MLYNLLKFFFFSYAVYFLFHFRYALKVHLEPRLECDKLAKMKAAKNSTKRSKNPELVFFCDNPPYSSSYLRLPLYVCVCVCLSACASWFPFLFLLQTSFVPKCFVNVQNENFVCNHLQYANHFTQFVSCRTHSVCELASSTHHCFALRVQA